MTNAMTYKGYAARIGYDDTDGIFTGRLAGIRDGVGFHADTVEDLRAAFHEAVDAYIETCTKLGKHPQRACSGQMMRPTSRPRSTPVQRRRWSWRGRA